MTLLSLEAGSQRRLTGLRSFGHWCKRAKVTYDFKSRGTVLICRDAGSPRRVLYGNPIDTPCQHHVEFGQSKYQYEIISQYTKQIGRVVQSSGSFFSR